MKKLCMGFLAALITITVIITCANADTVSYQDTTTGTGNYINGTYQGQTKIDIEGYNALANVKVTRGRIAVVDWQIYDNHRDRFFDATYEEVYTGNELYIHQCRDNMVGMIAYGPKLIETQAIEKVDNITGATWCYKKFKEVMGIALEDAYADTAGVSE